MMTRARLWLDTLRTSLWFVPGLIVLGSVVAAYALLALDAWLPNGWWQHTPWLQRLLDVRIRGANAMLQVIGGSMITVVGVVFSITITALTLASTQYTSRVLRSFIRDRANQVVLGSFLGIFVYCMLVMRSLSGASASSHAPPVALLMTLVLAFVGIIMLIFFIHHISLGLQASRIVASIAHEALASVDRHFPAKRETDQCHDPVESAIPAGQACPIRVRDSGFVTGIDQETLMDAAIECDGVVRVLRCSGEFVTEGETVAELRVVGEPDAEVGQQIAAAWSCGKQRTLENDPGFGIRQLVDVAIKALSPAVNETTTGIMCVNWLGVILGRMATRHFPVRVLVHDGRLRVLTGTPGFGDFLALACDQIRQTAAGNVTILIRLLQVLTLLARIENVGQYRQPLLAQTEAIAALVESSVNWVPDREPAREQVDVLRRLLNAPGDSI